MTELATKLKILGMFKHSLKLDDSFQLALLIKNMLLFIVHFSDFTFIVWNNAVYGSICCSFEESLSPLLGFFYLDFDLLGSINL